MADFRSQAVYDEEAYRIQSVAEKVKKTWQPLAMNHAREVLWSTLNLALYLGYFYYRFIPLKPGLSKFRKLSEFMDSQCAFRGLYLVDDDIFSELL